MILVVEDDPQLRFLYRMALMYAGHTVVAVEDGVDALRHIDVQAPQAVVLECFSLRCRYAIAAMPNEVQALER
jgi:DNA-binding response OmpR family regulator